MLLNMSYLIKNIKLISQSTIERFIENNKTFFHIIQLPLCPFNCRFHYHLH